MKKYFFLFIILFTVDIDAQRITLCRAYTNKGEPIDLIYSSRLTPDRSVCILFSGENKKLEGRTVHLFIDKIGGGIRKNHFSGSLNPAAGNWVVQVFKFRENGKYEIYFTDENRSRYSALTAIVGHGEIAEDAGIPEAGLYDNAEVLFAERVQYGRPVNIRNIFSLENGGGIVHIYLNNKNPIPTGKILLNIWRRSKPGIGYDEFCDTKKFQIEPGWSDTYLRYTFKRKGDYRILLYDEREILIKTAYISVIN